MSKSIATVILTLALITAPIMAQTSASAPQQGAAQAAQETQQPSQKEDKAQKEDKKEEKEDRGEKPQKKQSAARKWVLPIAIIAGCAILGGWLTQKIATGYQR